MSVSKRLTRDKHGTPILTITVAGPHDIYRLSRHMLSGQVEFCELGHRSLRSLRKLLGRERYAAMENYFNGGVR